MVNEVEAKIQMPSLERSTFTQLNTKSISVNLSTAREWDPRTHESLVMIDSGGPKWFGNSKLEQSDGATCLRGANGKPLQEYGRRQIWLKNCGQTTRYDFHVVWT